MGRQFAATVATGLTILAVIAPTLLHAAAKPNFSGHWLLDRDASDDPAEKMREAGARRGGSGGPGMGGPMGRGPGGTGNPGSTGNTGGTGDPGDQGSGGGGGPQGRRPPVDMHEREAALAEIEIADEGTVVTITDLRGSKRTLYTDGRESAMGPNGQGPMAKARWKDNKLVVEGGGGRGPKMTETYERSETGARLTVTVKMEGAMGDVTFRRLYDLMTDGAEDAPKH